MVRGKSENDTSIIKKVTCNLLMSRRDQKHNQKEYSTAQKLKNEMQRLPSPSGLNKGNQASKAINLLPYYTEAQSAAGVFDEGNSDMFS